MDVSQKSDKNMLDLFHKLCDQKINIRINACKNILCLLLKKQEEMDNPNEPCKDLQYAIERLVKGLASPREAARIGYTLLLTEIIKHMDAVQIDEVVRLVNKYLSIPVKQDKREFVFGQLFAYTALSRSGKLVDHHHLTHVILSLNDLCLGKSYILNASYKVILNLFSQLSNEKFKENVWPQLKKKISGGWENCSPDLFWLLLLCLRMFPDVVSSKYLIKHWGSEDIFSSENSESQKRIIKATTACLPELHPLCLEFLSLTKERKDFKEIWISLIDESLFDTDHTDKSIVGFQIIKKFLQTTPQKQKLVKCVLASRFQNMFSKLYNTPKHPLNPAANDLAQFFCEFVKQCDNPDIQVIILRVFLQHNDIKLDQILKKKEVSLIIQSLLPDAVKAFYEFLKSFVIGKGQNGSDSNEDDNYKYKCRHAIIQIGNLASQHPATINDFEWRISVVKFLFLHSFFMIKEPSSNILHCEEISYILPKTARDCCISSFYKALDSLSLKTNSQISALPQFLQHLLVLVDYADLLIISPENVTPVFPLAEIQECWNQMKSLTAKLNKQSKKDGKTNESFAFQVLFLQLGFLLFHEPNYIPELLEELFICCKKALKRRKHAGDNTELGEDEPSWIGVIVDILLSLLSKHSQHVRRIVTSVFPLFCPFITKDALQNILDVIDPEKSQEPVLVDEAEEDNVENAEFESGSSGDESDINGADEIPVDEEFKEKVKNALGAAADSTDAESVVLSDSEMFKLDDALSEVFKSQTKINKETGDKMLLNFRIRCLDLIIAYLKSDPPMHLVLQCIEPLIAAYEHGYRSEVKQLHLKTVSTLQVLTRLKKFQPENVEKSELKRLLEILISKCHKETDLTLTSKLYNFCVFLVLCFRKMKDNASPSEMMSSKTSSYIKIYLSALDKFRKESHINPQFFTSLMEACPDVAWYFIEPCLNYAFSDNTRMYKKTQCLGLILEALKFSKNQKFISVDQWRELGEKLIPLSVENIKSALINPEIKPVYMTELLNVLLQCHTIVKEKTKQSPLEEHTELVQLLNGMTKDKVRKLTKKGNGARRKVILILGGKIDLS